ncbi:MAG: hypothetical protein ACYCZQ_06180 [Burkholderiales bacterium]
MFVSRFTASLLALSTFICAAPVYALNYNELEVYPYQTAQPHEVEIENRNAYTQQGTHDAAAPDNNRGLNRNSTEFVYGLTDHTEAALYLDYQKAEDGAWTHAAKRVRIRHRFAEKGEYPVDIGVYAELERPYHENNTLEGDIKLTLEKDFGLLTLDFNPTFSKVLKGVETNNGWGFGYAAAAVYRLNETWHPRLDFFGDLGRLSHFAPHQQQTHLVSPAVDVNLGHGFKAGFGVAFGLTRASEQRLIRTRIEYEY